MNFERMNLPDVVRITPARHQDSRGFFSEVFRENVFNNTIGPTKFVQENLSFSALEGTLRGLHFQRPPFAQGKLIRCLTGAIYDVAVDLRMGSPTYKQHAATTLSAQDGSWFWVPEGFAHGFVTLEPETSVLYKVTDYYAREADAGVIWNDPDLAIAWPKQPADVVLSEKDQNLPRMCDITSPFQL